ncbi:MAG: hypothetical protein SynsKO_02550 [Synoicihabitans sp.]
MNHPFHPEVLTPLLNSTLTWLKRLLPSTRCLAPVLGGLATVAMASSLSTAAPEPNRLLNLSSRAWVGNGADVLIAGFVVSDGPEKEILIRAVGPTLRDFGVNGAITQPTLEILNSEDQVVASNTAWTAELNPVFETVGAFALLADSADAALLAKLAPGAYTAIVRPSENTAFGEALVEVYDVSGPARLTNLSTRARVTSDQSRVISGLVVAPGGGNRRLLLRAVGPTLQSFGVADALSDPVMALIRQSDQVQIASNDNWESEGQGASLSATFAQAGAFALDEGSRDAAMVTSLEPGSYTVMVSGANGSAGPALIEVYDLTEEMGGPVVTAMASIVSTDTSPNGKPGEITISRTGSTAQELTVNLTTGGSAQSGTDYVRIPANVTIPAGQRSVTIAVTPYANTGVDTFSRDVEVRVSDGSGYTVESTTPARVTIFYDSGTLYFANLNPRTSTSNGFGTVALKLASDLSSLTISARFNNLSSPVTAAYIRLGVPGQASTPLVRLPSGATNNTQWEISQTGSLSPADILTALREGRIFATAETVNNPQGELTGSALQYDASAAFTTPPTPAPAPLAPANETEAARFLTQATFGPSRRSLSEQMSLTYADWINAQMALPSSSHLAASLAQAKLRPDPDPELPPDFVDRFHRHDAWWDIALNGNDQLRQRVAFALSQILVISDIPDAITDYQDQVARYYDILVKHAFGDYRDLLQEVTLDPLMGVYLSHLQNAKANPTTGSVPDENYARELMQLFSIGLVELHPDGSLKLDGDGLPIPTYDQKTITETAKVFTGWGYDDPDALEDEFYAVDEANDKPMRLYPSFHDDGAKTIVTGRVLPAGQGGLKDLQDTIDTLINHPNTGPFIARRLIQRLVTSNPSPGYIYRVGRVFADNGSGRRGDLAAVVKAILLDPEARSAEAAARPNFGKIKEPMLRISGLLRAFDVQVQDGGLQYHESDYEIEQAPLAARSVFNFFRPDYVPIGRLAASGLVAPELQITNDTTAITVPNRIAAYAFSNVLTPAERAEESLPVLDISRLTPLWGEPNQIIDELNLMLCAGTLSDSAKTRLRDVAQQMGAQTDATGGISSLIFLVATSPFAAVQN